MKENVQKVQRYWGAEEVDGGEGNPWVEKTNKKNRDGESKRGKPWIKIPHATVILTAQVSLLGATVCWCTC